MTQKKIIHGSTFSGIGAPEVAAEMLGWENAFHCEINPFGRSVLDYYFPHAESYEDITKQDFTKWRGKITVLTGGFPCQPFSYAGKRKGSEDDRYLWPYMLKCIQQIRPTWFVGENVAGITTMVFPSKDAKMGSGGTIFDETNYMGRDERYVVEEICQQLEDCGYSVQPMLIPACAVGAPHRRDRVFFIAHRDDVGLPTDTESNGGRSVQGHTLGTQQNGETERMPSNTNGLVSTRLTTHPAGSRSATHKESGRIEINGSNGLPQQSQRRNTPQWTDGLSPLQGTDTDTNCDRGREIHQSLQSQLTDGTEPICNGGQSNVADTRCKELQAGLNERGNSITDRQASNRSGRSISQCDASDTKSSGYRRWSCNECGLRGREMESQECTRSTLGSENQRCSGRCNCPNLLPENRWRAFPTVSPVYRGNDGLPFDVDNLTIPFSKWKKESLKAYGNAIVVQVMYRIFDAIDKIENNH